MTLCRSSESLYGHHAVDLLNLFLIVFRTCWHDRNGRAPACRNSTHCIQDQYQGHSQMWPEQKSSKNEKKTETAQFVSKSNLRYFSKKVDSVQMDILDCASSMSNFSFKMLDTMGYVQNVIISQDSVGCGCPACRKSYHHAVWILHNVFRFSRNEQLIYKKNCRERFPRAITISTPASSRQPNL